MYTTPRNIDKYAGKSELEVSFFFYDGVFFFLTKMFSIPVLHRPRNQDMSLNSFPIYY